MRDLKKKWMKEKGFGGEGGEEIKKKKERDENKYLEGEGVKEFCGGGGGGVGGIIDD